MQGPKHPTAAKAWSKPVLERVGTISQVAMPNSSTGSQGASGGFKNAS